MLVKTGDRIVIDRARSTGDEDITLVFLYLSLFLSLVITLLYFSTTLIISEKYSFIKPINRPQYFLIGRQ